MLTKTQIRQDVISKCCLLNLSYRETAFLAGLIHATELIKNANSIAIYHAYGFEFNLANIIELADNLCKSLYTPMAYKESKIMRFSRFQPKSLEDDSRNNLAPKIFYAKDDEIIDEIEWYNIDLVFVPLVAVSVDGYRLGKGGGYYDATFANINDRIKKPLLCGIGFDLQIVDQLPVDKWDIKLDYFISDKRILKF